MHIPLSFTKMHGLGNSYIYIDARQHKIPSEQLPELAIKVSDPGVGIGSDGLIIIEPSGRATVKMRMFNKDGSEGKRCGNGLRCVAKYAFENGYCHGKEMTIETASGIVEATIHEYHGPNALVSINMGPPQLSRNAIPMQGSECDLVVAEPFQIKEHLLALTAVSMGNPHAVFFVKEKNHTLHHSLGPVIELDERFPERVNVEFVFVESPHSLHCSVWERGSGLTQACGTGACASAAAAILNGFCKKEEEIAVHLAGGTLSICWNANNNLIMKGFATTVASGTLLKN